MKIPKIIHQSWKTEKVPEVWHPYQAAVKKHHPDWKYILWTDETSEAYVAQEYPDFLSIYQGFSRNIMRADVFRYLIMYKMGGMYLDLDYEMLRPFDFEQADLVLPMNREIAFGDAYDGLGNAIFASVPGHPFWKAVIDDMIQNPPKVKDFTEIVDSTGPMLLTRIYEAGSFPTMILPGRHHFHRELGRKKSIPESYRNDPSIYGVHHCAATWRERFSWAYVKLKAKKMFRKG